MKRRMISQAGPHPADIAAGERLRAARRLAGYSQGKLAAAVGLTFQQVQKYEKGMNRMGASRLSEFSRLLNVTPAYFFDPPAEPEAQPQDRNEANLLRNFRTLPAPLRLAVLNLAATAANGSAELQGGA